MCGHHVWKPPINDITDDFINLETDFTAVNHDDGQILYIPLSLPFPPSGCICCAVIAQVMMYLFNSIFGLARSLDSLPDPHSLSRHCSLGFAAALRFPRVLINAFVRDMAKCSLRITGREGGEGRREADADWVFGFKRTNGLSG